MKKILATTLILAGIGGCGYLAHANNLKQETIDEQATKIEQLEEENSSRANEITNLKNTVATLQNEKSALEEEKLSLISSRTEKIQEINALQAEIEVLKKENNDLKTGERILELEKQVAEYESIMRLLSEDLETLNRELESKNATIAVYEQYIADLEREEVVAKFYNTNGNVLAIQEYKTGDTLGTLPTFDDNDDWVETTFNYWYEEGSPETPLTADYVVNGNINIYANVTKSYYVNFEIDGSTESVNSQLVEENGYLDISKIPTATKENYTFLGWSADFGQTVIEDLSTFQVTKYTDLVAVFEINKYDLTFKVNGETVTSAEISHGCTIGENIPTPEVPDGMRFLGWRKVNIYGYKTLYNPQSDWVIAEDTTYIAVMEHNHAGTFESEDGNSVVDINYSNGDLYLSTPSAASTTIISADLQNAVILTGTESSYYKYTYDSTTDTWSRTYNVVMNGEISTGTPVILSRTAHTEGVETW